MRNTLRIRIRALSRRVAIWVLAASVISGAAASFPLEDDDTTTGATREQALSIPESAQALAVFEDDRPQLKARLLVSKRSQAAPGDDDTAAGSGAESVGVLFDLAPGWHIYWRNPGGTGIAPSLGLEATHASVGEILWPSPETFREADGLFTTYGYEGQVLLSARLSPALEVSGREPLEDADRTRDIDLTRIDGEIRADATVLICRTQCVPASFTLSTPADLQLPKQEQKWIDDLFARTQGQVPIAASDSGLELTAHWVDQSPVEDEVAGLRISVDPCRLSRRSDEQPCPTLAMDLEHAVFLPMEGEVFEFSPPIVTSASAQGSREANSSDTISMQVTRLEPGPDRLQGLVRIQVANEPAEYKSFDIAIAPKPDHAAAPIAFSASRWMQIFLLALLGGFILNGMPCVLPVLAIKVVAIADMAEKDPREVRLHGLAYTGGILASMAALAAIVLGLRAAGHSVGWGFQFQEPLFVASIGALLVAFALNLFGVFEIEFGQGRLASVGQEATGLSRSAFEGLLAVILATPCTAPFLGTAVGFAFASSGFGIAAIFLAIGLGLASPFLVVSFFPALARFIPRSGPWMLKLRAGLGFSLLATVVWLLWIVGQSGGSDAVIAMTGNLLFLAFLLWVFGQVQPLRSAWVARAGAISIALLAMAGFNLIDFDPGPERPAHVDIDGGAFDGATDGASNHSETGWQRYSERAVAETLASGRSAFVVFTADWCITCQVNKHRVLERKPVQEAFARSGIALFEADWTKRDEAIRVKLAEFGRAGVPLYLVYSPDAPSDPIVLSELLSQREVIASLPSRAPADSARPAAPQTAANPTGRS